MSKNNNNKVQGKKKQSPLGAFFAYVGLGVLTIGVMLFLGKHSLNFFTMTFKGGDEIFAWLGLLLTSGGAILWLAIFMWLAETTIQKGISLIMMIVALLGEFATAGFDMYIQGVSAINGFEFVPEEVRTMTLTVAVFGIITGFALVGYTAGDKIIMAFKDTDGDGTPDLFDTEDNRQKPAPQPQNASRTPQLLQMGANAAETKAETLATDPNAERGGKN